MIEVGEAQEKPRVLLTLAPGVTFIEDSENAFVARFGVGYVSKRRESDLVNRCTSIFWTARTFTSCMVSASRSRSQAKPQGE